MDNGLVPRGKIWAEFSIKKVLILIVVDNGLVLPSKEKTHKSGASLNPYCSGQWSRTNILKR